MTTNSIKPRNPKWSEIRKEIGGFGVAELVSEGVWLGLVAVEDYLIPDKLLKSVSKAVASVCIEPFLDPIEAGLNAVCKLDECKPDPTKSRAERAEQIAKTVLVYTPAIAAAWEAKVLTRRYMNKRWHVDGAENTEGKKFLQWTPQEKMIFLADEGLHLGALYVMNNQMAPVTDNMIRNTTSMIKNTFGTSDEKAHELAAAAWIWAVPNGVGALAGALAITGKHLAGWPKGIFEKILGGNSHDSHPAL